jgi:hypothetical protein
MMKGTTLATLIIALSVATGSVMGCSGNNSGTNPSGKTISWNGGPAKTLGITASPVTADQARQIAEEATGGVSQSVEQEDEDGTQVFGVHVLVGTTAQDVKVRVSDGAVLKVEADDDGEEGGEEGGD